MYAGERKKMIDIGILKDVRNYGDKEHLISEIVERERHNLVKYFYRQAVLDVQNQNEIKVLGTVFAKSWRVIALGLVCEEATTDNEAVIVHFGTRADVDCLGIMTLTATASKGIQLDEYTSVDPYGVLPADDLATDSPTVTWTEAGSGSIFNTWQTTIMNIQAKAITASMTSGQFTPYALIEVDTQGKY